MKKRIIAAMFCTVFLIGSCAPSKPSWETKRPATSLFDKLNIKDSKQVTQTDKAVLGILFSGMVLFVLHTFTTR